MNLSSPDPRSRFAALLVIAVASTQFLLASSAAAQTDATPAPPQVTVDSLNPPQSAAASPSPQLEHLTGVYEFAPGRTVTITLEKGVLHGQPSGGEKRALEHASGTTFSVTGTQMTLAFTLDTDGHATTVVMKQNDRERIGLRVR